MLSRARTTTKSKTAKSLPKSSLIQGSELFSRIVWIDQSQSNIDYVISHSITVIGQFKLCELKLSSPPLISLCSVIMPSHEFVHIVASTVSNSDPRTKSNASRRQIKTTRKLRKIITKKVNWSMLGNSRSDKSSSMYEFAWIRNIRIFKLLQLWMFSKRKFETQSKNFDLHAN